MAKISRNGQGVRRSAAARSRADTARHARDRTGVVFGSAISILPFSQEQLQRIFLAMILGGAAALAWFVASLAGVPAMAESEVARLGVEAGFQVRRVQVTGAQRVNELMIYERVLAKRDTPMSMIDLGEMRASLLELSWIKEARVSRQLPDKLVVEIVERKPYAVLRRSNDLALIDAEGVVLEPVSPANARGMLVVAGEGSRRQTASLIRLLNAAPALKPQIDQAEWVGNRRWNFTLATDQVISLPQGESEAASALVSFATLDGRNRLLGGKVAHFDMRIPGKMHMRIPGRTLADTVKPTLEGVSEE